MTSFAATLQATADFDRIVTRTGAMAGGPMYVLERGMNAKWLGMVFAALTSVAAFGIGGMTFPYRVLWVIAVMVGSVQPLAIVWTFSDIASGLTAIPNLIALLGLSGVVVSETREYLWSGNLDKASPPQS